MPTRSLAFNNLVEHSAPFRAERRLLHELVFERSLNPFSRPARVPSSPQANDDDGPALSVVAPLYNESPNVQPLVAWILQALESYPDTFEVILVDDGSSDDTWSQV